MTQIPLSRAYVHTPWPVCVFHVMSKPGGPACNMECEYCYYRHHQDGGKAERLKTETRNEDTNSPRGTQGAVVNPPAVVSEEALERFVADYMQSQDNPTVFFVWQGGEPTLVGLDFYRKVIAFQQKHARKGVTIANSFQTNGILIDDDWCEFFAQNKFHVGLSIDGPADIHDAYRRLRGGAPTFARVRLAAECLKRHSVHFTTLSTITPASAGRAKEFYGFLTGEIGSTELQIQPCAERKDFREVAPGYWPAESMPPAGSPQLLPGHPDSILTDWSISAQQWGRFLCDFFDCWWPNRQRVHVSWFESWASQFAGGSALQCMTSPICGRAVSMEQNGDIYRCDHFVYPEYRIGVAEDGRTLSDLVRTREQKEFGEAKSKSLPGYCRRCPFLFACYGECPKRRFLLTPEGEPGLNYLCAGFRTFFDHAGSRLALHGRRRSPAKVVRNSVHIW